MMQTVRIVVGEPWDFIGPDENNAIIGTIINNRIYNNRTAFIMICSIKPIEV